MATETDEYKEAHRIYLLLKEKHYVLLTGIIGQIVSIDPLDPEFDLVVDEANLQTIRNLGVYFSNELKIVELTLPNCGTSKYIVHKDNHRIKWFETK